MPDRVRVYYKAFVDDLERTYRIHSKGVEYTLVKMADHVLAVSDEIVPEDQGPLRESGQSLHRGAGLFTESRVSYGGEAADYAVFVHEEPPGSRGDGGPVHGASYNVKYAKEIALGLIDPSTGHPYHSRRPQETYKFLQLAVEKSLNHLKKMARDSLGQFR